MDLVDIATRWDAGFERCPSIVTLIRRGCKRCGKAVSLESPHCLGLGDEVTDPIEKTRHWPHMDPAVTPMAAIYMLRTVQQHHVQLSVMADVKASIIITAASILVTAFMALSSAVGAEPGVIVAAPLVLTSLGFAIFAVLPKASVNAGPAPGDPGFNLLFFNHFGRLTEDEFLDQMMGVIGDVENTYVHQIKDIYQLDAYLRASKYRYLRLSYFALFAGVTLGTVVEVVSVIV